MEDEREADALLARVAQRDADKAAAAAREQAQREHEAAQRRHAEELAARQAAEREVSGGGEPGGWAVAGCLSAPPRQPRHGQAAERAERERLRDERDRKAREQLEQAEKEAELRILAADVVAGRLTLTNTGGVFTVAALTGAPRVVTLPDPLAPWVVQHAVVVKVAEPAAPKPAKLVIGAGRAAEASAVPAKDEAPLRQAGAPTVPTVRPARQHNVLEIVLRLQGDAPQQMGALFDLLEFFTKKVRESGARTRGREAMEVGLGGLTAVLWPRLFVSHVKIKTSGVAGLAKETEGANRAAVLDTAQPLADILSRAPGNIPALLCLGIRALALWCWRWALWCEARPPFCAPTHRRCRCRGCPLGVQWPTAASRCWPTRRGRRGRCRRRSTRGWARGWAPSSSSSFSFGSSTWRRWTCAGGLRPTRRAGSPSRARTCPSPPSPTRTSSSTAPRPPPASLPSSPTHLAVRGCVGVCVGARGGGGFLLLAIWPFMPPTPFSVFCRRRAQRRAQDPGRV